MLDDRANWKIGRVREAHNELLDAMMQSYRNLIRFARRNNLSVSASPQDIGVLTRKLYAAFEALPVRLRSSIRRFPRSVRTAPDVYPRAAGARQPCRLVSVQSVAIDGFHCQPQPLELYRYLNKLVAWAWFNAC